MEALCREDAYLLSADTTISFMINNIIGSTNIAVKLKAALVRRINERRTSLSSLLHYLHKGHQRYQNLDGALSFEHISKTVIINAIVRLNERLSDEAFSSDSVNAESDTGSDTVDESANLSLKEKLQMAKDMIMKCDGKQKSTTAKVLSTTIRKEMALFEEEGQGGTRGTNLRKAYEYLKTVQPTSVEPLNVPFQQVENFYQNYDHPLKTKLWMRCVSCGLCSRKKLKQVQNNSFEHLRTYICIFMYPTLPMLKMLK